MTQITSAIDRDDMNNLNYEDCKIENLRQADDPDAENRVTFVAPMVSVMLAMIMKETPYKI